MSLHDQHITVCPYCAHPVSSVTGGTDCPHCARQLFNVPCVKCGRRTLNLTQLARQGKVVCFGCHAEFTELPEAMPTPPSRAVAPSAMPSPHPAEALPKPTVPRAPTAPTMPSAAEARATLEHTLVGLERAAQDREMLRAPDLRTVVMRFLDAIQDILEFDTRLAQGEVSAAWLHETEHLALVARMCYTPCWPIEGALLPLTVQAWILAVDDVARSWQYAARQQLAELFGLTLMPTVPTITTTNPAWHEIEGEGPVIREVLSPGFLLHGELLRRAHVRA